MVCLEEVDWARLGRGYSELHIQLLLLRLGCLLPLGLYLSLAIAFPREMDLPFPGIKTLGNWDPSHPDPGSL